MTGHLLLLCLISVTAVSQADGTVHQDIIRYMGQIQIIRDMLAAENCVDPATNMVETSEILGDDNHLYDIELEIQRKQYLRLRDVLIECRIAASRATTIPTTLRPIITPTPVPAMCLSAINLTEPWRQDHHGANIKPNNGLWNCDAKMMVAAGRPWFRFSGAGGHRLMNKCVPTFSCGTAAALWSDDPMPTEVGVIAQANAYAAGEDGNCKRPDWTRRISVVRCSTLGDDYVYRYDDTFQSCYYGFCGLSYFGFN